LFWPASLPSRLAGKLPERNIMKQLVYRQRLLTRLTHWIWAASLFFLLLSGLQIFNAHPTLYLGNESGFDYDNAIRAIFAVECVSGPGGRVDILGKSF